MLEAGKKYADSFTEYEKRSRSGRRARRPAPQPREKIEGAKGAEAARSRHGDVDGKGHDGEQPPAARSSSRSR